MLTRHSRKPKMKLISFSATTPQMRYGLKDVTRRVGWSELVKDQLLLAVEKAQGLRRGDHVVPIGVIKVLSVRTEQVADVKTQDIIREGFPDLSVPKFVRFFCKMNKIKPRDYINRIEFTRLYDSRPIPDEWWSEYIRNVPLHRIAWIGDHFFPEGNPQCLQLLLHQWNEQP